MIKNLMILCVIGSMDLSLADNLKKSLKNPVEFSFIYFEFKVWLIKLKEAFMHKRMCKLDLLLKMILLD